MPARAPEWSAFLIDGSLGFFTVALPLAGNPSVVGSGNITIPAPIPDNFAFVNAKVYFQALVADALSSGGVSHSDGMYITICDSP